MAEGSLRCDANVSIRPSGATEMGTRTETKNVNSFRFLEHAINFEVQRQQQVLESGGRIVQETRLYDPDRDETRPMRSKETAMDYRYFPEPDLLPVKIDEAFISEVKNSMPELPREKATRFADEYQLTQADAQVLASDPALANYFEATVQHCHDAKTAANWVRVELLGRMNRDNIHIKDLTLSAEQFGVLLSRISDRTISGKIAKDILDALWQGEAQSVDEFIEKNDLKQVSDSGSLDPLIEKIIADNPKQAEQYRQGKTKLLGFFVGQVMKETAGKANPQQVNELVRKKLS
jgi:aspartyl-tRNA(Asn)/glutamyl-tRNA(Gln) amidotransferase subunit B